MLQRLKDKLSSWKRKVGVGDEDFADPYDAEPATGERPWKVESERGVNGQWYPHIKGANGEIVWTNPQGYRDRTDSDRAIVRFMSIARGAGFICRLDAGSGRATAKKPVTRKKG